MQCFIQKIRRISFTGTCEGGKGGGQPPSPDTVLGGVVNNGILISHMGVVVVNTGS